MYLYPIAINIVLIDLLRIFAHLYSQKSSILFKVLIDINQHKIYTFEPTYNQNNVIVCNITYL